MTRLRYHFPEIERMYVNEYNSNIHLTVPDQAKSVAEIIAMSVDGVDPLVAYVPDMPYSKDLSDIYPNVDELNVTGRVINNIQSDNNTDNDGPENIRNNSSSNNDSASVSQEEQPKE